MLEIDSRNKRAEQQKQNSTLVIYSKIE